MEGRPTVFPKRELAASTALTDERENSLALEIVVFAQAHDGGEGEGPGMGTSQARPSLGVE